MSVIEVFEYCDRCQSGIGWQDHIFRVTVSNAEETWKETETLCRECVTAYPHGGDDV